MLEKFTKDGLVLIPNFFKKEEIVLLDEATNRILDYTHNPSSKKETHFHQGTRIVYQNGILQRVVWAQGMEEVFNITYKLIEIKSIINQLFQLSHDSPLVQIINQLHLKVPNDGTSYHFHQDAENRRYGTSAWRDVLKNGSFLQTVVALGPLDKENGTLKFLPGSHHEGFLNLSQNPGKIEEMKEKYGEYVLECKAGDMVVFHPFCIHGSGMNRSSSVRKVFINGFCPPRANLRHYPGCGVGKYI